MERLRETRPVPLPTCTKPAGDRRTRTTTQTAKRSTCASDNASSPARVEGAGASSSLLTGANAQLLEHRSDMVVDGADRDNELIRDLCTRAPLDEAGEHLRLPRHPARRLISRPWLGAARDVSDPDFNRYTGPGPLDIGLIGPHPDGSESAFEIRALFSDDQGAVREDPVTGSLNAAAGQWLFESGRVSSPYLARQGTHLGRNGQVQGNLST